MPVSFPGIESTSHSFRSRAHNHSTWIPCCCGSTTARFYIQLRKSLTKVLKNFKSSAIGGEIIASPWCIFKEGVLSFALLTSHGVTPGSKNKISEFLLSAFHVFVFTFHWGPTVQGSGVQETEMIRHGFVYFASTQKVMELLNCHFPYTYHQGASSRGCKGKGENLKHMLCARSRMHWRCHVCLLLAWTPFLTNVNLVLCLGAVFEITSSSH